MCHLHTWVLDACCRLPACLPEPGNTHPLFPGELAAFTAYTPPFAAMLVSRWCGWSALSLPLYPGAPRALPSNLQIFSPPAALVYALVEHFSSLPTFDCLLTLLALGFPPALHTPHATPTRRTLHGAQGILHTRDNGTPQLVHCPFSMGCLLTHTTTSPLYTPTALSTHPCTLSPHLY